MKEIDYALAPAGATHEYNGMWRMLKDGKWFAWIDGEWNRIVAVCSDDYEPIPEREQALNRLADNLQNDLANATVTNYGTKSQEWIDELEQKVKDWEQSYNQVTSAWSHDKISQQAKIDALLISTETAWRHAEQAQADRKHYGVHLAAALKGEKLASEPVDQRLDAVRDMRNELIFMLEESYIMDHYQDHKRLDALRKKYKVKP